VPKITASEIKRVISQIKSRELALPQATRKRRASIIADRRKLNTRVKPFISKAGIEVEKIEALIARSKKEEFRFANNRATPADKIFQGISDTFRPAIAARVNALELANKVKRNTSSTFVTLDKPFIIWAQPSNILIDSRVSRLESLAKIRLRKEASDFHVEDTVSFYYVWENPSNNPALVNVETYIVYKGFVEAGLYRNIILPQEGFLDVRATLRIFEWWNQPPTQPVRNGTQFTFPVSLTVHSGGFWDPGDSQFTYVLDGFDPKYNLFTMPPKGVAVFDVETLILGSYFGKGLALVDFAFDDYFILCPYLQLEILTAP
jgi:hypothetical protein